MLKILCFVLSFLFGIQLAFGQNLYYLADSIRVTYNIPELAYAVVSADSVFEMRVTGVKKIHTTLKANNSDRFRIGSNTKTVTSYIAAVLVKQGKLKWDTRFFDLYPELKSQSNAAYHEMTLLSLLTFRTPLISWTYTNDRPTAREIKGTNQEQRYNFIAWILRQPPVAEKKDIYWSNPSYVAVGLMLERATNASYENLVAALGEETGIRFGFGQPNNTDSNQPWGHDEKLIPEKPSEKYKLNRLSSAGNINVSLPDYSRFIQLQLQGLAGLSKQLSAEEFEHMHYGWPGFALGWKWYVDEKTGMKYSFHEGNPGSFLTKVFICKSTGKAFILFANIQSSQAEEGLKILLAAMQEKYKS